MKQPIINNTTKSKLQSTAQGTARIIRRMTKLLGAEIHANTVEIPREGKFRFGPRYRRPETVTYRTQDIENLLMDLDEMGRRLDWYSVPTEMRGKLDPPRNT